MDIRNLDTETIISKLSWRPLFVLDAMICIRESIQIPTTLNNTRYSSFGLLSVLPIEVLHMVLNLLDFQSLSRLTRTSHLAKATVESLPAYRDLIKHAPKALVALSKTQLIKNHSAISLHTALRSENCLCCQSFAPWLYLPTCERCCYNCLWRDRSMRLITCRLARKCFGLTLKEINRLPTMLSIPGTYSVGYRTTRQKRFKLVSWRQARELGIAIHGSAEAMESFVIAHNAGKLKGEDIYQVNWLTRSFPGGQNLDYSYTNEPNDPFCGMGSVNFPVLRRDQRLDDGLWCFGCRYFCENQHSMPELFDRIKSSLPRGCHPTTPLLSRERQAWSRVAFVDHVRQCECARYLLREIEQGYIPSKW